MNEEEEVGLAFTEIFTNEGIDLNQFLTVCRSDDHKVLIEFVRTVHKFISMREKPDRPNPIGHFTTKECDQFFHALRELRGRFEFTVYEMEVNEIITMCQTKTQYEVPKSLKRIEENLAFRLEDVLDSPQVLDEKFENPEQLFRYVLQEVLPKAGMKILGISDHKQRYEKVYQSLVLCNKLLHPAVLEVQISMNTLIQTRLFKTKYYAAFYSKQKTFLKKAATIINEALLSPSDLRIQACLLKLLKRCYWIWGQEVTGPLFINLRNISYYSDESAASLTREASIFCYKIIQSKIDIKFGDMLDNCEELAELKQSEHYSSKGLTLPDEFGETYDTGNLDLPFWMFHRRVQAREVWVYPVIVEKSNTMVYWKLWLQNYDINFGIYKVSKFVKYSAEAYDKQRECKQLQKLAKIGKKPITKGHMFLKNGLYHFVFDNSFSMVRAKDLVFHIHQLESTL